MSHDQLPLRRVTAARGCAPFLKWAGGKRWLVRRGLAFPQLAADSTYYEPFLGGGAMFFALGPHRAVLSDVNDDLITAYSAVRDYPLEVIARLHKLPGDQATFRRVRDSKPRTDVTRAVRFLYLNRTAFGGLYRVNRAGKFNVPFAGYSGRAVCQPGLLLAAAQRLSGHTLATAGYEAAVEGARRGDVVYFDPPYTSSASTRFVRYNDKTFSWSEQRKLADTAFALREIGVHVVVSNTDDEDVLRLYHSFSITIVKRHSNVSRDPSYRTPVTEAVISSYDGVLAGP